MIIKFIFFAVLLIGIAVTGFPIFSHAQQVYDIPDWVKNTAGWWATDAISEEEFVNAIEFLVNKNIIKISEMHFKNEFFFGHERSIFEDSILNNNANPDSDFIGRFIIEVETTKKLLDNWKNSDVSHTRFNSNTFYTSNLNDAVLQFADLSNSKIINANLKGADLSNAKLINSQIINSNLSGAVVLDTYFDGADLSGSVLSNLIFIGTSHEVYPAALTWKGLSQGHQDQKFDTITNLAEVDFSN